MPARNEALFTSDTAEHNTPPEIVAAMRDVFGDEIELDPASNEAAQAYIKAERAHYVTADPLLGGLAADWTCRTLWLNPPFTVDTGRVRTDTGKPIRTRVIGHWVDRWIEAVAERRALQAGLLVPARTDTEWFAPLFGLPMCFTSGRLRFSDAANGAPFPTVIVYCGPHRDRFFERFAQFGHVGKFVR